MRNEIIVRNPNIAIQLVSIHGTEGDVIGPANATSIPIAESIQRKFDDSKLLRDLGKLSLNISGCMNACGHHHVGNIGILGVDKKGEEFYQIAKKPLCLSLRAKRGNLVFNKSGL